MTTYVISTSMLMALLSHAYKLLGMQGHVCFGTGQECGAARHAESQLGVSAVLTIKKVAQTHTTLTLQRPLNAF
jgi:hypothetical protein